MNSDNNQKDYTIVNQETLRHKFLSVVKTVRYLDVVAKIRKSNELMINILPDFLSPKRMCLNPIQAR